MLISFFGSSLTLLLQLAEDMFKELTRKLVEENISTALNILKSRTRASYVFFPFLILGNRKDEKCMVRTR